MPTMTSRSLRTLTLYPTFVMYVTGVSTVTAMALSGFSLQESIIVLSVVAVVVILIALMHEVRIVHRLVSKQRRELLAEIDKLTHALEGMGMTDRGDDV